METRQPSNINWIFPCGGTKAQKLEETEKRQSNVTVSCSREFHCFANKRLSGPPWQLLFQLNFRDILNDFIFHPALSRLTPYDIWWTILELQVSRWWRKVLALIESENFFIHFAMIRTWKTRNPLTVHMYLCDNISFLLCRRNSCAKRRRRRSAYKSTVEWKVWQCGEWDNWNELTRCIVICLGVLQCCFCLGRENFPFLLFHLHTTFMSFITSWAMYSKTNRVFRNSDDAGKLNKFFLFLFVFLISTRRSHVLYGTIFVHIFHIVVITGSFVSIIRLHVAVVSSRLSILVRTKVMLVDLLFYARSFHLDVWFCYQQE